MTHYTKEKKEHALTLMSAPQNKPVPEVSQLTGIPEATLYLWRKQARSAGRAVPGDGQNPEDWSAADKFAVVLETAPLGEAELAEYCRQKGLFVEQVRRWRSEAQMALGQVPNGKAERAQDKKRIRELEKDLRRKEKALAEAAALLVLSRKYEALRTDDEDA
ncbi:transposase [Noviherbaspirillum sp. CPCC 100848]|uniref:Transposase n=1 Tax=Noviherbaspirillum album TaxID=3080276 RepID=A0ABU6JIG2_9BURK|nr:transposase [Noviherbaspirillum sp. CPCC 100848]MEC4723298.1 transposase [Noviherbaspirillum sp. CPCC 100848]